MEHGLQSITATAYPLSEGLAMTLSLIETYALNSFAVSKTKEKAWHHGWPKGPAVPLVIASN